MTVTVACLIKAGDEEADSHGAVGQEVKRQSLEKLKDDLFFSSSPRRIYTTCSLGSQSLSDLEALLNLCTPDMELANVLTSNTLK